MGVLNSNDEIVEHKIKCIIYRSYQLQVQDPHFLTHS